MSTMPCFGLLVVMFCQQPDDPPKPTAVVCPPLVEWNAGDQQSAGAELSKLPAGHPLRKMAVAAVKQRAVVSECIKAKR
jgi:hypothetical protein